MYCYKTTNHEKYSRSSNGYCVYDALCGCGQHNIFFGPHMMLDVQQWRAGWDGVPGIMAGNHQMALPEGVFHLRGFFVHIMTPEDWAELPPDHPSRKLWYYAGRWIGRYEFGEQLIEV